MADEQTNKTDTKGNEPDKPVESSDKPISIVDEARAIRDEIRQEREKLEAANTEQKKLQSEALLSGTSGGHVEPEAKPKEISDKEYAEAAIRGEITK